jgi:hypothetical protein
MVTPVTSVDAAKGEESHRYPRFLPDGRRFVFLSWNSRKTSGQTKFTIQLAALNNPTSTTLVESSGGGWVDPGGYLLFAIDGPPRLMAAPFDVGAGRVIGEPITVADKLEYNWIIGESPADSAGGTLVYLNRLHRESVPTWFDRTGREVGTLGERGVYYDPVLSPDGRSVLVERADPNTHVGDLIRIDTTTGTIARVIHDPGFDNVGLWSPDGRRIVFSSDREGLSTLFQVNADGSGVPTKLLTQPGMLAYALDWSGDGRNILFMGTDRTRVPRLWTLSLSPTPQARQLSVSRGAERDGALSPDGRWIAYASDESGDWQVYVRRWPSLSSPTQVSLRGGIQPQWRRDGRELFYATLDGNIMSAGISGSAGEFQRATPTLLFAPSVNVFDGFRSRFTVSSDGQRFLVLKPVVDRRLSPITAVINWTEVMAAR